jgi:O-antigen ligase
MVWIVIFSLLFVFKIIKEKKINQIIRELNSLPNAFKIFSGLFLFAGTLSLFTASFSKEAIGQYIVLFVEPFALFVVSYFVFKEQGSKEKFISALFVFAALSGVLALIQYFTLFLLPSEFWGNIQEPKRAISFFAHPNGYALFIAPVLAFLLPHIIQNKINWRRGILWGIGIVGLLLSLSRGGWLGLLIAGVVWVLWVGNKQIKKAAFIVFVTVVCLVAIIPNFRYRVILPFKGEKSSMSRFSLWNTGLKMIKDNPVLGKGLTGFDKNWYKYNSDPGLDHYNFPHNIFLNFWVDTGILGVISFSLVSLWLLWYSFRAKNSYAIGLGLFVLAVWIHGQIDIPYLKNDLASLWWIIVALGL